MFRKSLVRLGALVLTAALLAAGGTFTALSATTLGSGSLSYRVNVLAAIGAADSSFMSDAPCTRAEFAKLLVLSSSYRDTADTLLVSAAANDVPSGYSGAQYIKTALTNGWMRTRLGGNFAPEDGVTLNDAAKATVTILGYTDSDFSSNLAQERLSLFKSLDLNDGVSAVNGADILSKSDALNIIYNLLRTYPKNSINIYGSSVNLTLSSSGELNATSVIESTLSGPLLIKSVSQLESKVPFDLDSATFYFNGKNTGSYGRMYIESQIKNNGWIVLYYNANNKVVWAYGSTYNSESNYYCIRGKVTSILYDDENIAAPVSVCIDSVEYELNNSEVQFMFSMNGSINVGDYVVLITKETPENEQDIETAYYAVAVVMWDEAEDGSTVGTIFSDNSTVYRSYSAASQ